MKTRRILAGAIAGVMAATQVLAATNDNCLQHNRLQSWRAVDESTLVMTDRFLKQYTVRLGNHCGVVTHATARLTYRTWQNLACLRRGEIFTASAPGLGSVTCSVASVQAGAPAQ